MNWKRFVVASVVVYVVLQAMDFVINSVFLKADNEALKDLWRPDMASKAWIMYVTAVLVAFLFTYIFIKGREGKGLAEGVRYGIVIWLFVFVPMMHGYYVMLPIPYIMIFRWLLFSLLEVLIAGGVNRGGPRSGFAGSVGPSDGPVSRAVQGRAV
jgi:hypothetical protein